MNTDPDWHQVVFSSESRLRLWNHDGRIHVRRSAGESCLLECIIKGRPNTRNYGQGCDFVCWTKSAATYRGKCQANWELQTFEWVACALLQSLGVRRGIEQLLRFQVFGGAFVQLRGDGLKAGRLPQDEVTRSQEDRAATQFAPLSHISDDVDTAPEELQLKLIDRSVKETNAMTLSVFNFFEKKNLYEEIGWEK
ncbi:hypothetical protein TNCV_4720891 [Trichonephila clavipes]|uniref:Uncharacterized protein n=1 Tax=Trichonephila clavipes TaxID=2585209 RepID=A0A8X6W776_TRICX|nr:hypothetical protein TNCV_4720891 [Trichonephila clavipes]